MTHRYERYCDLVCEGGGVKGIALAGAYSVLEEHGYEPQNVAGTSAGAITAALIVAGYRADELREIVLRMNFLEFRDRAWEDQIPLAGRSVSVLKDLGVYEGKYFESWIRGLLAGKGVSTFADLVSEEYRDDRRYRFRLQVIASDVSTHRLLVLPRDAGELGFEPEELDVASAVRMSMSIPIFFEPSCITNEKTGREHVVVDGGMLSNYPVWLYDSEGEPDWPTFGLLLVEPDPKTTIGERLPEPERAPRGFSGLITYVRAMAHTMMEAHDRLYVEKADFARTIPIPTLGVGTMEFGLSDEQKEALYQSGRDAAATFLDTWDFEGYIAEFRRGKEHHRRREIAEEVQQAAVGY